MVAQNLLCLPESAQTETELARDPCVILVNLPVILVSLPMILVSLPVILSACP